MAISDGTETCLNLNDALHAAGPLTQKTFINALKRFYGKVDYVFCGYGSASHFPNCYLIPGKDRVSTAIMRQRYFNQAWARSWKMVWRSRVSRGEQPARSFTASRCPPRVAVHPGRLPLWLGRGPRHVRGPALGPGLRLAAPASTTDVARRPRTACLAQRRPLHRRSVWQRFRLGEFLRHKHDQDHGCRSCCRCAVGSSEYRRTKSAPDLRARFSPSPSRRPCGMARQ